MFTANIAGVPVALDFATLPEESKTFLLEYGVRQYLQDGAAVNRKDVDGREREVDDILAEKKEGVRARLNNVQTGTFARRNTASPKATPEDRERHAYIYEVLSKAYKATGNKLPKVASDEYKDKAAKYYAKYQAQVDKEVGRRVKAASAMDLDLNDIM